VLDWLDQGAAASAAARTFLEQIAAHEDQLVYT
jgi:hypothetical protein